jgi:hypothetical protein
LTFAGTHFIKRMSLLTLIICKLGQKLSIISIPASILQWERGSLRSRRASPR